MSGVATAKRPGHNAASERVVAAFERSISAAAAEPSWLAETRRRAMARFVEHGFPTTRR